MSERDVQRIKTKEMGGIEWQRAKDNKDVFNRSEGNMKVPGYY